MISTSSSTGLRPELWRLLDVLPPSKQAALLDFARFLHEQSRDDRQMVESYQAAPALHAVPAATLKALTGIVALGGDALADSEALYDGNHDRD